MMQMLMRSGGKEQILELEDTSEFVLLQFCDVTIRHQDLRDPDMRDYLRQMIAALKVRAEREEMDNPKILSKEILNENIFQIERCLNKFEEELLKQDGDGE